MQRRPRALQRDPSRQMPQRTPGVSALVSCAHQILRKLLVRAGGGFGSVPGRRERVWITAENIR
jgi:hypothetical protein